MGTFGRARLGVGRLAGVAVAGTIACTVLLVSAGGALAASPSPDPAPTTTTTKTTTTTPKPTPPPATAHTVTHTTTPARVTVPTTRTTTRTTVKHAPVTRTVKAVSKTTTKIAPKRVIPPKVTLKPRVTHKPKPALAPVKPKTTPVAAAVAPGSTDTRSHSGSRHLEQTLLVVAALLLLSLSIVPTQLVVSRIGIEPERVTVVKTGLAAAGIAVGAGFLIAHLLGGSA